MCLYELLLLQGGCAVLSQPHPEEAVVDDIAAIVLVDEFSIDQRLESKTHAAGKLWRLMKSCERMEVTALSWAMADRRAA